MCAHRTSCNPTDSPSPHVVAAHPEQGWTLLCDGAIVFDDTGNYGPTAGSSLRTGCRRRASR